MMEIEISRISDIESSVLFSAFRFDLWRSPQVPLAVPFWNGATFQSIRHCLLNGQIVNGPELGALQAALRETLDVSAVMLCASGSLALETALRALGIGRGDDVLVPALCCSAVIQPILAVAAVPVLADVGQELNMTPATVKASLTTNTRAIIVPHLFGNPAEIGAIAELARIKNIQVIDDAAQALGATIAGRPVGALGNAGVISFGREKICSGLGGGAVIFPDGELGARAGNIQLPLPARSALLNNLLATLFWHRWRRGSEPLRRALPVRFRREPDKAPPPYRNQAMANLNAAVARSLLENLQENLAARRACVQSYRELLGSDERLELIAHRNGSACLTQVLRVLPRRRSIDLAARVIRTLNECGYEVQGSYIPIHLLPGFAQLKAGPLAHTENVWEELIELPCEPGVKPAHVERIAAIIKQTLDE